MKKVQLFIISILMISGYTLNGQTAITTDGSEPDGSAMLEVKNSNKGVLLPRMTTAEMAAIDNPANGLTVFNTTENAFYIFNATDDEWKEIAYGNGTIEPKRCIIGSGDACSNTSVSGSYIAGVPISVNETVTLEVEVINIGDYSISTNEVNGYSFSASGTFSSLGTQEVVLQGTGTPIAAKEDEFTATANFNGGACTFIAEVEELYAIGSGGTCENTVVNGDYIITTSLTASEYVSIQVDVTNPGDWSISTNTVNGYSFSGSGTFTSTGIQTVNLYGSGTPLAAQTDNFTATASNNGGTCTFSVEPEILAIGDSYRGGIVAYILQSGDPGYVEGETRGLIAAETDQSTGAEWGCYGTSIQGADGTALGTGSQNTLDIVNGCSEADICAKICADLELNGYDDWFLPSKNELNKLYLSKDLIGGFASDFYRSSSESSSNTAWRQNFTDGIQHYSNKTYKFRVRAVRTFPTQNLAPVAYNATVSGVLEVGEVLTGSYTYADFESDPEGTSTFQWYRADDATGTNQSAISGATAETYELAAADAGKYISFEVTPVAATGTSPGTPTMTDYDGPVFSCGQSFVDIRDDKSYTTVEIGTQCWMAENLAYLPAVVPPTTGSETNPYYYVYGYQGTNVAEAKAAANFQTYGVLYNWPASSTACPDGWHLPSDAEWITLEESLGMCTGTGVGCSGATAWRGTDQGSQIAGNAGLWANGGLDQNPSFGSSGFNALPGGRRWTDLTFDRLTTYAFIWTSSDDLTNAWRRALSSNYSMIGRDSNDKSSGFSVRCVRDYYTIGSGNACENTVVNGDYNTTFALTEYEYVSLDVDVTNTGVWSISTNTVNGYSFSGSGTFTSTGTQSVTLAGSGTPLAIQTDQFTATADQNGGSCTFSVDVVAWSCGDHITDSRDGNVYETVQIGDQCWMAENLNYDQSAYGNDYCYDNETSNCDIYGRLYDWDAIMQGAASSSNNPSGVKGVCPDGWHLPSDAEWTELTDYVSSQPEYLCNSNTSYIAKALAATSGWNPSTNTCAVGNDLEANNATGFAALPGGYYYSGSYLSLGSFGNWWSCTQYPSTKAWSRPMYYYNGSVIRVFNNEARGFSVRCLRD